MIKQIRHRYQSPKIYLLHMVDPFSLNFKLCVGFDYKKTRREVAVFLWGPPKDVAHCLQNACLRSLWRFSRLLPLSPAFCRLRVSFATALSRHCSRMATTNFCFLFLFVIPALPLI